MQYPWSKSDWYCSSYGLSQFKTLTFNYGAPCRQISVFLLQRSKATQCIIPSNPVNIGPVVSDISSLGLKYNLSGYLAGIFLDD